MTETMFLHVFMSFLIILIVIVGMLSLFFMNIRYNIIVKTDQTQKEIFFAGQSLLSSSCLTDGNKGMLIESKLKVLNSDISCLKAYDVSKININIPDTGEQWNYFLTEPTFYKEFSFFVSIRKENGDIKLGTLKVEK